MATPSEEASRRLQKLASLATQRRRALGIGSTLKAGKRCGMADATYRRIEKGLTVDPDTYFKLETGFDFVIGSCHAVLAGADSITLNDGTELIDGAQINRFDLEGLAEEFHAVITGSATLTAPGITLRESAELSAMATRKAMEILRRRGLPVDQD